MILVTGASGKTGRAIISALTKVRRPVRALIHRQEQVSAVQSLGAEEAVVGDMRSNANVTRAMQGVESVYHICPNVSPDELTIGRLMIDAARVAMVRRFVFHSVLHPQVEDMPHHWLKMRVEECLFKSGLPFVVLQPAAYMQNVLSELRSITETGVYKVPYSVRARMSLVDLSDVAEVAKRVLTEDSQVGGVYELAGGQILTPNRIASILARLLGRSVRAEQIPIKTWTNRAVASGLSSYQVETLVKMFKYYDQFGFSGNSLVLRNLLGRDPTTFEEFASREIAARAE